MITPSHCWMCKKPFELNPITKELICPEDHIRFKNENYNIYFFDQNKNESYTLIGQVNQNQTILKICSIFLNIKDIQIKTKFIPIVNLHRQNVNNIISKMLKLKIMM